MCGIAGIVKFDGSVDPGRAAALSRALAHRGPDGEGVFASPAAVLVHRRLAIIDPTPAGAQPMAWANGRYQLVYNGEVYNYRELRAELESHGERFQTASDTEVLLRLVATAGPAALERVRGMFALALWDAQQRVLLLARDRFGIKPLYVASLQQGVAFASEIGALRRAGVAPRTISTAGILAYLSWASIPAPLTWLRGVEQVEPGTWLRFADGVRSAGVFADVTVPFVRNGHPIASEPELRERAAAALRSTVAAHLVADVPVGLFLSGGVDSAALVAVARSIGAASLNTYTVVVDETAYSEEERAREVARRFETKHHVLRVDASSLADDLPDILQRLDQPTADAVNSYYVSRAVASTGIKTVLSGVGGDELFGGYPSFVRIPTGLRVARALGPARLLASAAAGVLPGWRAAKLRHFCTEPDLRGAYRAVRGFLMPSEIRALAGPALADGTLAGAEVDLAPIEARLYGARVAEEPLAAVARLETRGFMGSQLLRDIDAVSMAHSLEVRVPYVDHELQAALWPSLAYHPALARGKRLLRDLVSDRLPPSVLSHPKQGFTLPFQVWLGGPLGDATRAGLHALESQGWIAPLAGDAVWRQWTEGQAHWSRPWGLGMLGRFLEEAP
jgi:asparagine synthase (glutamine-hydrolysing)